MKRLLATVAAIALLTTTASAAPERSTTDGLPLYTGTYWKTVFYTANHEGEPMCVTSGLWNFNSGAKSMMMLKWQPSLGLFVHILKTTWRFGPDIDVPMSINMDAGVRDGTGTTMKSSDGKMSMIQINITGGNGENFIRDFAATNRMVIKFKSGNEGEWSAQMQGSSEAAQALMKCIDAVKTNSNTSPVPPQASSPVPNGTSPVGKKGSI